jgi:hypothetical protein
MNASPRYVVRKQHRYEWWVWDTQDRVRIAWYIRRLDADIHTERLNRADHVRSHDKHVDCPKTADAAKRLVETVRSIREHGNEEPLTDEQRDQLVHAYYGAVPRGATGGTTVTTTTHVAPKTYIVRVNDILLWPQFHIEKGGRCSVMSISGFRFIKSYESLDAAVEAHKASTTKARTIQAAS